jgi:hypothetical protein
VKEKSPQILMAIVKKNPSNLTNPNNGDVEQGHVHTPTKVSES